MFKSIIARFTLTLAIVPALSFSQDTLLVEWTGTPGNIESTIMGDTTTTGEQAHDVYLLEANKVYLQLSEVNLYTSCSIVGEEPGDGEHPATIQPLPGDDGTSQFTGWPQNNFKTYGDDQEYEFKNLLMNGAYADQSSALFGVLATYGSGNTIRVTNVTSVHNSVITYFNFGQDENWYLHDNKAVQYTCYPGGMYFGGFWWGAGAWGGTVQELVIQNNTIEGCHGEGLVIWDNGPRGMTGIINHNTFVNIMDWPKFYRGGNNTLWTNNLFVNTTTNGQTYNSHGFGPTLNWAGGQGVMSTLSQSECTDSTLLADGNCWDNHDRNIHYESNAWFDTDEFAGDGGLWSMDPWCWDVTDTAGNVTTYCDTMLPIDMQSKWTDDSTTAQLVNGVTSTDNIHGGAGFGFELDPAYMNAQISRTMDWLDNQVHDTYTDYWWTYQADDNYVVVEWPLPMDFGYSGNSAPATHCSHGGPAGSSEWMDHEGSVDIDPGEYAPMEISADDGDLYEIISADTLEDGTQAHEYVLTSTDKTYKMTGTITSKGDLTIVGELGEDGRPPTIQSGVLADGTTVGTLFVLTGDESVGYFEDLYLLANATNGAASGTGIEVRGDEVDLHVYGCIFDAWQVFAIAYNGQWDNFYIHDNIFRNMVHPNQWYIGEVLRNTWPGEAYTGTVSMVGNVMIGINGYAAAPVSKWYMDYFEFSNNAVLYTFKNPFFIFNMTEGEMNDNIFYGNYSGGVDRTEDPWWDNLWFPDTSFGVIALQPLSNDNAIMFDPDGDTSTVEGLAAIEAQRDIEISGNACYWAPEVTDFWAAYNDTATNWIRTPVWMNDRTVDMFADDAAYPLLVEENNVAENPGIPSEFDNAILHGTSSDGTGDIGLLDYFLQVRSGTAASDYWGFGYTTVEDAENWVPDWPLPEMMLLGDVVSVDAPNSLPEHFTLHQNYPNPFNPTTEISFSIDQQTDVTLTIYNMLGQTIKVLEKGSLQAGTHTYKWNGRDKLGQSVASGVYLYNLTDGSKSITKKMALMK